MMMTLILGDTDILQACATCLAGVLIFLTIERKLNIVEVENKIASLKRNIEYETKTLQQLEKDKLKPIVWTDSGTDLNSEITEHTRRLEELQSTLKDEEEKREFGVIQYRIKNREDIVTFLTLLFLTSCIVFLIFSEIIWPSNYLISRSLFTLGLISLLVRVVYRAIDLPPGFKRYLKGLRGSQNNSNGQ